MANFDDVDSRALSMALNALGEALKSASGSDAIDLAIETLKRKWKDMEAGQYGGDRDTELEIIQQAIWVLQRLQQ